jgi:ATP-binding cassette subfamily F protein 3
LDIPSQEILQSVLGDFQGTIILVSHDRYLIDALSTQIWEIDADRAILNFFKGTYSEYRTWKEASQDGDSEQDDDRDQKAEAVRRARAAKNRALAEQRRRQSRLEEIESRIAKLEKQLTSLGEQLAEPPPDPSEVQQLGDEYVRRQDELTALMVEWEKLHS